VVATGLPKAFVPSGVVGAELLMGYDELFATGRAFENQSVMIWGFGNAAHESARELQKYTQAVTLMHRRAPLHAGASFAQHLEQSSGLPRFAFFTHYPGDIRTVTMQIYDSYLLKALDVKLPYGPEEEPVFLRCLISQLCVWVSRRTRCGGSGETRQIFPSLVAAADGPRRCAVAIGAFDPGHRSAAPLLRMIEGLTSSGLLREGRDYVWADAPDARMSPALGARLGDLGYGSVDEYLNAREREYGIINEAFVLRGRSLEFDSGFLSSPGGRPLLDLLAQLRPRFSQGPLRHPFHAGIRCLGWRADLEILAPDMISSLLRSDSTGSSLVTQSGAPLGKYPRIRADYQAEGVPRLYFVGALAHSRDYRRSAGGFIHGFRYTARSLYRILRREEGLGWPNSSCSLATAAGRKRLMRRILRRTNEAAGPYQMFGELGDVVLFRAAGAKTASELVEESLVADYLEEVPLAYVHGDPFFASAPRLILSFVYGRRFGALDLPSPGAVHAEFGELSAFLHPRLELFAGCPVWW